MTNTEMERAIESINHRLTNIEQILPTLAAKRDLERYATKAELAEGLSDVKRYMLVLFESQQDTIRIVAEAVVAVSQRVDALTQRVDFVIERVDALTERIDVVTARVNGLTGRLDGLIGRLERKGVI